MNPVDYARLAQRAYTDAPTIGDVNSASRMHVYGDVHCFRGSDDVLAFLYDADCRPLTVVGFGKMHSGFWHALSAILPACLALPRPAAVTGHSLGAAMAILYGAVLARLNCVVPVYAFEPPHICFDGTLGQFLNATRVPVFATRNGNDVVTDIPLGLTLPATLTRIGKALLPFDNIEDHSIGRVVEALAMPIAAYSHEKESNGNQSCVEESDQAPDVSAASPTRRAPRVRRPSASLA